MQDHFFDIQFQKPAPAEHPIHEALRQRWSPRAFAPGEITSPELHQLFEALRWAPSAFNEQPWSFLVGLRQQPAHFDRLFAMLTPGNQAWAKDAAGLFITVARRDLAAKAQVNRTTQYDLGQAVANFTFQATALGLIVHQMAGVDLAQARAHGEIPEGYDPVTAIAFGRPGDSSQLPEDVRRKDAAPRVRKRLQEFVFGPTWGQKASWLEGNT